VPQNHDGRFQAGPHPARPIGRGGSNQRESLASPDSPSHCASFGYYPTFAGRLRVVWGEASIPPQP
jgi:hypothetical protein